jgi:hypothetical protein
MKQLVDSELPRLAKLAAGLGRFKRSPILLQCQKQTLKLRHRLGEMYLRELRFSSVGSGTKAGITQPTIASY